MDRVSSMRQPVSDPAASSQLSLAAPDAIPPPACLGCQRQQRAIDGLTVDLENVEVSLRVERRRIKSLLTQIAELEGNGIPKQHVEMIFKAWATLCRTRVPTLGVKRRSAVLARLRDGKDLREFGIAIEGAAAYPYKHTNACDELELICRDEVKFESFYERGERALAHKVATGWPAWSWRLPDGLTDDQLMAEMMRREDPVLDLYCMQENLDRAQGRIT